jgi:putative SOS response-associated peptidase YedK
MCNRVRRGSIDRTRLATMVEEFSIFSTYDGDDFPAKWNVAPTDPLLIVRNQGSEPQREFAVARWGLVPFWAKDAKIGRTMTNARAETISDKPAWREPFRKRRCIVLVEGYYEAKSVPGRQGKLFYDFSLKSGGTFALAGLWDRCDKAGAPLETATVVTTTPNSLAAQVHDRMPVILSPEAIDLWLDPSVEDPRRLLPLLAPFDAAKMLAKPLAGYVNRVGNEGPQCLEPADDPTGELVLV